ncbi:M56 family metallopeptidase [Clostridium oryzae]|uniref:Regulatory protein BlaR1 n=1 Tax=Clostridium oryzae TaxID=1450648 RepID=A0A1V4ITV0_9CLOT|nr:M56 family metallopeptidase [Clostridium oryzae]OPJ62887.1 regulatory protein BlaR1 [Clostridium oryzae]
MNDFIGIQLLFFKVLENSISASMIVIIIFLIRKFTKKVLNARFISCIWIVFILKLVLPFTVLNFTNIENFTEPYIYGNLYNNAINITANSISEIQKASGLGNYKQIKKQLPVYTNGTRSKQILLITDKNTVHAFKHSNNTKLVLNILSFTWFIGCIIYLCSMVYKDMNFKKAFVKSIYHDDKNVIDTFLQCKNDLKIKKDIKLIKSGISMPVIHGIFKPAILLPYDTTALFTTSELRYILLHELIHYKKKDLLLFWLINILSAINWFNPLIHIAINKIEDDCEFKCDLKVLSMLESSQYKQYGMLLIKQAEFNMNRRSINSFCPSLFRKNSQLKFRIKNIVNYNNNYYKPLTYISAICIALFFLFILFPHDSLYRERLKYIKTPPTLYAFWIKDTNTLTNINSIQSMTAQMVSIGTEDNNVKLIGKFKLNNRIKYKLFLQATCPLPVFFKKDYVEIDTKSILKEAKERKLNIGKIYLIAQYQISTAKPFTSAICKQVLLDLDTLHKLKKLKLN